MMAEPAAESDLVRANERAEHLNRVLRSFWSVSQLIVQEPERDGLLKGVCESLVRARGYYNAWIALWDDEGAYLTSAEAGLGEDFARLLERLRLGKLTDCCVAALDRDDVVVVGDPFTGCRDCPLSRSYAGRSAMSTRLEHDSKVYGVLSVSAPKDLSADEEELLLFRALSDDVAFALHKFELSRQRQAAEELARRRQVELAHVTRLSTMGEMATALAHELNQPLCAISSSSQACMRLLRAGTVDTEEVLGALEDVDAQAQRAAEIIRRVRAFVRKREPQRTRADINALVRDALALAEPGARRRHVTMRFEAADGLPLAQVDTIEITQVVFNLIRNAIEAMGAGPPEGRYLEVRTSLREPDALLVAVSDTGPGLPDHGIGKVFDAFYTTKPEGMGMGLSICQSIVVSHGGELWAENGSPRGATFQFTLPTIK
ncbi:MAG: GAF domain-containing protein [Phycisphaerae bacterium]|nr:GAF domain-containing protein [Phycisphaerae bacterium]